MRSSRMLIAAACAGAALGACAQSGSMQSQSAVRLIHPDVYAAATAGGVDISRDGADINALEIDNTIIQRQGSTRDGPQTPEVVFGESYADSLRDRTEETQPAVNLGYVTLYVSPDYVEECAAGGGVRVAGGCIPAYNVLGGIREENR